MAIGYWLLAVGYWLLAIGYWLWFVGLDEDPFHSITEANVQDFHNLHVWKNSHTLALGIYKATKPFPKQEMFGLTSQIQRAAVSIPANVAEGCGKATDADFARYVQIAMG